MKIEILNDNNIRLAGSIFKGELIEGAIEVTIPINFLKSLQFDDVPNNIHILTDVLPLLPREIREDLTYLISCSTDIRITRTGISYTFDIVRRYYANVISADLLTEIATKIASLLGFNILRKRSDVYYSLVEFFFQTDLKDFIMDVVEKKVLCLLKSLYELNKLLRERIESTIDEFLKSILC